MEERKTLGNKIDGRKILEGQEKLTQYYSNNREVKKNKKDKNQWFENFATKTEKAARKGNMKAIYDITKSSAKLNI